MSNIDRVVLLLQQQQEEIKKLLIKHRQDIIAILIEAEEMK